MTATRPSVRATTLASATGVVSDASPDSVTIDVPPLATFRVAQAVDGAQIPISFEYIRVRPAQRIARMAHDRPGHRSASRVRRPVADDEQQERRLDDVDPGDDEGDDERQCVARDPTGTGRHRRDGQEDPAHAADETRDVLRASREPGEAPGKADDGEHR